jgi:hypothetical protein
MLQPLLPAFLRKLALMLPQAFCDPSSTRLDVLAEFQHIVMAGIGCLFETLLSPVYFFLAGPGQFVFVLLQTFRDTSSTCLNILAEFIDVIRAGAPTLCVNVTPRPQSHAKH